MPDINASEENISTSEQIRQRINTANNYWEEICLDVQKGRLDKYSRHIIFLLPDIIEELKRNQSLFAKNRFGRLFFARHLKEVNDFKCSENKSYFPSSLKASLNLIIEALENKSHHNRFDIEALPELIEEVYRDLTAQKSYEYFVNSLVGKLNNSKHDIKPSKFYFQTIVLILFLRGRYPDRSYFQCKVEKNFDDYHHQEIKENEDITEGNSLSDDKILESVLTEIAKNLKEYFPVENQELVVIFQVRNLEIKEIEGFRIGNVHFYDPEKNKNLYINEDVEMTTIEKNSPVCAAVTTKGLNNVILARKAKRAIERASAFLPMKKGKRNPIFIANSFEIFDPEGNQGAWSWNTSQDSIEINASWSYNSQEERARFGKWLTLESNKTQNSESVSHLLRMIDIHRRGLESQQQEREILESWFSFESLSPALHKCSIRLPARNGENWISGTDKIQTKIQALVIFSYLRQFFRNKASNTAQLFYSEIELKLRFNAVIDESTKELFFDGKYINWSDFLTKVDDIEKNISKYNPKSSALSQLQEIREYFFDIKVCKQVVCQKISEISEDVYNIYRLRNMLVHSGYTDSPLLNHYASRSLIYGSAVIQTITAALYQEKVPSSPLEFYLQKIFIRGNLALEALLEDNDEGMERFRNWIIYDS